MLYYASIAVKPENRMIKPTGEEADDALEPLVGSGVPSAVSLRVVKGLSCGWPSAWRE